MFPPGATIPRALPWADLWKPLRGGCGQTAQHQNWRFGLVWVGPTRRWTIRFIRFGSADAPTGESPEAR